MTDATEACNDLLELCARRVVYQIYTAEQEKTTDFTSKAQPSLLEWLQEKVSEKKKKHETCYLQNKSQYYS